MRRLCLLVVALALPVACSGGGSRVGIVDGRDFDPGVLVVSPGTTVTFANESDEAHTVTAVDGVPEYFSSGGFGSEKEAKDNVRDALIAPGDSYEVTFEEPGVYEYFCIPHAGEMQGTIEVEE
jgi:plastocyanin